MAGIGERSDAVLRTAMSGHGEHVGQRDGIGCNIRSPHPEVLARLGEPRRTRAGTPRLRPSFETRASHAPQDEVGVKITRTRARPPPRSALDRWRPSWTTHRCSDAAADSGGYAP